MHSARHPEDAYGSSVPLDDSDRNEVLEEAMRLYGDTILHLAYSYVKDYALAEDITQEVFLRVYRHMHRFEGRGSLKTWIYSIAVNYCRDHVRSWSFRKLMFTADPEEPRVGIASAEQTAIRQLEQSDLWKMVLRLPVKHREVIVMHYQQDLPTKTVADILGVREQTVRTRLHRARESLRKLFAEGGLEWMHLSGD